MNWRWLGLTGLLYQFWSGFGGVFVPVALQIMAFGALYWWHHVCHVRKCLRIARHTEPGTSLNVCRVHSGHPARISLEYLENLRRKHANV